MKTGENSLLMKMTPQNNQDFEILPPPPLPSKMVATLCTGNRLV